MDTWGISGPDFLVFYVVLLLLAMVAARLARRLLGPTDASDGAGLGPYEAALLNGGEGLALNAAFASLHGDGHITAPRAGEVEVGPTPLQQAHPLERALLGTLRAGPRRVKDVRAELASCPELSAMRDTLEQQELLPGPDGRASARAVMVAIFVPLLALAFAPHLRRCDQRSSDRHPGVAHPGHVVDPLATPAQGRHPDQTGRPRPVGPAQQP